MKAVKFLNKDKTQFSATLRNNVNAYFNENEISVKGNGKIALKTFILFGLCVVPFIIILTIPMSFGAMLLLSVLIGIGMAGIGMSVTHDSLHGSFSSKSWLNKLVGLSIYMLGGSVLNWNIQHNIMHHAFTNIQGFDEDVRPRAVIRLSTQHPLYTVHRFQHIYAFFLYSLFTLFQIVEDFDQLSKYNRLGITKQQRAKPVEEYIKMFCFKAIYLFSVIVLPILFTTFNLGQILVGFLLMHLTAGLILCTIIQMGHIVEDVDHPELSVDGNIDNEWAIHQLYTTSNFAKNNYILNWFIGGLNFQIEHHLFPYISHVHYHDISSIVEKTALDFGLPYNMKPTLKDAIVSHIRMLKKLGAAMPRGV